MSSCPGGRELVWPLGNSIGPFIRGKIRRVLNKTRTVPFILMSYIIRRVLAKPRLILDEMCCLYGKFTSYLRPVLCKTPLIFPRINGPNVPYSNELPSIICANELSISLR